MKKKERLKGELLDSFSAWDSGTEFECAVQRHFYTPRDAYHSVVWRQKYKKLVDVHNQISAGLWFALYVGIFVIVNMFWRLEPAF